MAEPGTSDRSVVWQLSLQRCPSDQQASTVLPGYQPVSLRLQVVMSRAGESPPCLFIVESGLNQQHGRSIPVTNRLQPAVRLVNNMDFTHRCVSRRNTAKTSFPMRLNDLI